LEYNYRWKKLGFPGNIMVSAGIALPLLYGGLVHGWPAESLDRVTVLILFEAMIFLANLGREISKGIADMEGDRLKNIETLALRYGPKKAARAASAFYISAVALSFIPPITSSVSRLYIPLVAIADVGFIASAFTLVRDFTKEGALRVKSMVLLWMLIGLLAFILGAFR
jgi:geranylgeranylglycerol-phosphate geranylgeranyltransferase